MYTQAVQYWRSDRTVLEVAVVVVVVVDAAVGRGVRCLLFGKVENEGQAV